MDVRSRWEYRKIMLKPFEARKSSSPFFIFSDRIEHVPPGEYESVVTNGGQELKADLIVRIQALLWLKYNLTFPEDSCSWGIPEY